MRRPKVSPAMIVAIVAVVFTMTGVATAAKLLTGSDVKNGSLTGSDIKKRSIPLGDLSKGAQDMIRKAAAVQNTAASGNGTQGAAGAQGAKGDKGDKGDKGEKGDAGQTIVANVTTPPQQTPTTLVPVASDTSSEFTSNKGTALVSVNLPAGRYIVAGTALFYAVGPAENQYGEARLFSSNGTPQGSSIFSGAIPPAALGGVAAQTGASVEVNLTAADTLTLRARIRRESAGPSNVHGGANLLVTKVAA